MTWNYFECLSEILTCGIVYLETKWRKLKLASVKKRIEF